jgi:wyosine [tRNA(Phe)-imidazoG37] synthetase (radical SAM superfamily)
MDKLLPLRRKVIYGPVTSRRLGSSLGLNLLPGTAKVCSFDCVYCQYGRTTVKTTTPSHDGFPTLQEVTDEVEEALGRGHHLDYITFSGHGEATLHPQFLEIVEAVVGLRDRYAPNALVAILSNSTLLERPAVRQALLQLDRRFMKLDAGDQATFEQVNRPASSIKVRDVVEGLKQLRPLVIQTLMLAGSVDNASEAAREPWIEAVSEIKPVEIHLYSLDRVPAESSVAKVDKQGLLQIAEEVDRRTGVPVKVY